MRPHRTLQPIIFGLAVLCVCISGFPLEKIPLGSIGFQFGPVAPVVQPYLRADFDNDGNEDILLSFVNYQRIVVWFGQRDDKYDERDLVPLPLAPQNNLLDIMDLNNDGLPDVIASSSNINPNIIYYVINNGNRNFADAAGLLMSTLTIRHISACDVNNDGVNDVVISNTVESGYLASPQIGNVFNTITPITDTSSSPILARKCHRSADGTNYLVASRGVESVLYHVNSMTYFPLTPRFSFLELIYINPETNIGVATVRDSNQLISFLGATGENSTTLVETVPKRTVLGAFEYMSVYNDAGDFIFSTTRSTTHRASFYGVMSGDLKNLTILDEYQVGPPPLPARFADEPESILTTQNRDNIAVTNVWMYGPMLRPSIQPSWRYVTEATSHTIVGRNISQSLSFRVMWRVKGGACDISTLNGAENGCPSMSTSGDNITCNIPHITQDCIVQARVVANFSSTKVNRMSSWETQLVFGSASLRVEQAPTLPGQNGTRITLISTNVTSTFLEYPYEIALATANSAVCSGSVWHACESTYQLEEQGFSCIIYHTIEWVPGQALSPCPITVTLLQNQIEAFPAVTVVHLTKILNVTIQWVDQLPFIPLPSPEDVKPTTYRVRFTAESSEQLAAFPVSSDLRSSWKVEVIENSHAGSPTRATFISLSPGALTIAGTFTNGFLPSFRIVSKNGAYASDYLMPPSFSDPLSLVHVRLIPDESTDVVETIHVKFFLTPDWRDVPFVNATLQTRFYGGFMVDSRPYDCDIASAIRNNLLESGHIPIVCSYPYFSSFTQLSVVIRANETTYSRDILPYLTGFPFHPVATAISNSEFQNRSAEFLDLTISYPSTSLIRSRLDIEYGIRCPAFAHPPAPIQHLFTMKEECYTFFGSTLHAFILQSACVTPALNRTALDGCMVFARPGTQPASAWRQFNVALARSNIPPQRKFIYILNKGDILPNITITGSYLGLPGEEPYMDMFAESYDSRYPCTIGLTDGNSVSCYNTIGYFADRNLPEITINLRRFAGAGSVSQVLVGSIFVRPVPQVTDLPYISVFDLVESGQESISLTIAGELFSSTGWIEGAPQGLLMHLFFGGDSCRLSTSVIISYSGTVNAGQYSVEFHNISASVLTQRTNIDGCTLFMYYSNVIGSSVQFPLARIAEQRVRVDQKPANTMVHISSQVTITGSSLPREGENMYISFSSNTSVTCDNLVQQGNATFISDHGGRGTQLTFQLTQLVPEANDCNLLITISRGNSSAVNVFLGTLFATPVAIETASVFVVQSSSYTMTISGMYLPIETESPQVQLQLTDGPSPCRNKVPPAVIISDFSRTQLNFTMPYDSSYDSCVISATATRLSFSTAWTRLGTLIAAPLIQNQLPTLVLNENPFSLRIQGRSFPRSAAEGAAIALQTNCAQNTVSPSVTSTISSYENDGNSLDITFEAASGELDALDGCRLSVVLSRFNGSAVSDSRTIQLVKTPEITSASQVSASKYFVSREAFTVTFAGRFFPSSGEEYNATISSTCQNQPSGLISVYTSTSASISIVESRRSIAATFSALPVSLDGCNLHASILRFGIVSDKFLVGHIVSRPVLTASYQQLTADRQATLTISGTHLPLLGEKFSVNLTTNCRAFSTIECASSTVVVNGSSVSCSIVAPAAPGCLISARVIREGYESIGNATVAQIVAPLFPPAARSLTLLIRLSGSTPPNAPLVDQICALIGRAFNPPLVTGINITCSIRTSNKRDVAEVFNLAAFVVVDSAIASAEPQINDQFLKMLTEIVARFLGSEYTVEPIVVSRTSNSVDGGIIAVIVIGILLFIAVVVAIVILIRLYRKRSSVALASGQSFRLNSPRPNSSLALENPSASTQMTQLEASSTGPSSSPALSVEESVSNHDSQGSEGSSDSESDSEVSSSSASSI